VAKSDLRIFRCVFEFQIICGRPIEDLKSAQYKIIFLHMVIKAVDLVVHRSDAGVFSRMAIKYVGPGPIKYGTIFSLIQVYPNIFSLFLQTSNWHTPETP
jgi:hypothetical protein